MNRTTTTVSERVHTWYRDYLDLMQHLFFKHELDFPQIASGIATFCMMAGAVRLIASVGMEG
ncbi:MAG: hypothetical protein FJX02_11685 [Alphaproteobacteria bacterium]|nr:hypothetical protein [Alphaproteobacteria bacterium]